MGNYDNDICDKCKGKIPWENGTQLFVRSHGKIINIINYHEECLPADKNCDTIAAKIREKNYKTMSSGYLANVTVRQ